MNFFELLTGDLAGIAFAIALTSLVLLLCGAAGYIGSGLLSRMKAWSAKR